MLATAFAHVLKILLFIFNWSPAILVILQMPAIYSFIPVHFASAENACQALKVSVSGIIKASRMAQGGRTDCRGRCGGLAPKNVIASGAKQSQGITPLTDRLPRPLRRPRNDEG
jgi:hypothetical protein